MLHKIINRFAHYPIDVAASRERGKNPFPKDWRMHAFFMDALPILNEPVKAQHAQMLSHHAYEDIIEKLHNATEKLHYYLLDH